MSLLSRLFGRGGGDAEGPGDGEEYNDFMVYPAPIREGNIYRLSARITGEVDGAMKEHTLIRADTFQDKDEAIAASRAKAHQMIDQMGERLFLQSS
jgi:hypothetical protein